MSVRTYENRETKRRNADVKMRIEALHEALDHGKGWLSEEVVSRSEQQLAIARGRLRQSLDHTVVALAGPTGAGKSSLLNALAGRQVSKVSVRRPTTSQTMAVVWDSSVEGRGHASKLLDWLGVAERNYVTEEAPNSPNTEGKRSVLNALAQTRSGTAGGDAGAKRRDSDVPKAVSSPKKHKDLLNSGLIVVDLPDFDSVVSQHRVRADHLTARADVLVWVTDPQKYADAIFHHEYLRKFKSHTDMLVVLNQVDRLSAKEKEQCLSDIRRLLVKDGISGATVLATSTTTGEGLSELRSLLEIASARRAAQGNSLIAQLRDCGRLIAEECGSVPSRTDSDQPKAQLVESLAQAAGVNAIVDAVYDSSLRRSHIATGWPLTSWVARLRKDPLRNLGLASRWLPQVTKSRAPQTPLSDEVIIPTSRSSRAGADAATLARTSQAVRAYVDAATHGAPIAWKLEVQRDLKEIDLSDELDSVVANSPSIRLSRPRWWGVVGVLHKVFLALLIAGLVWLAVLAIASYLRLDVSNTPQWMGFPIPTLLTLGGLSAGIVLGLVSRIVSIVYARRISSRVYSQLQSGVEELAHRTVVLPVREVREKREACLLAALVAGR